MIAPLLCLFMVVIGPALSAPTEFESVSEVAMATKIEVVLPKGDHQHAQIVSDVFTHVEATANEWKEEATLAGVNRAAGLAPVELAPELMGLVQRGLQIGAMTNGAFDITWAAMWGTWDFVTPKPPPSLSVLQEKVSLVDYRLVEIDAATSTVLLPKEGMKLGLGGIAKGYALDLSVAKLRAEGVRDFTISAGGQVYASGMKGDRKWRIGVRDPRGEWDDFFGIVELSDQSVSTSGDYERFFEHEGVRYHHILDPKTGQPARGLRSVTIISTDATLGDALSTAIMVMGREKGIELISSIDGVEAVVVDDKGQVFKTSGVAFTLVHPPKR